MRKGLLLSVCLLAFNLLTNAQRAIVKGVVNSDSGMPLFRATVRAHNLADDHKDITITDSLGYFYFNKLSSNAPYSFTISIMGYKEKTLTGYKLKPNDTTNLLVTLVEDPAHLDDVVVTGFNTVSRKRFTGAATKLNADDIRLDGMVDASRMLEGRAPGVSVQNVTGTFGSAPKLRVRGITSLTGDNKPLWVIDGVVLEDVVNISSDQLSSGDPTTLLSSSIAGLNANDIESFDILKDAAATALYGAKAMNGVVVITTKKGKIGAPRVSYVGNFSSQLKPNYSNYDILNSADQMSVYTEMQSMGLLNPVNMGNAANYGVFGKMANLIYQYDASNGKFGLYNSPEEKAKFLSRYAAANTDWYNLLFRNNFMQEHSLSVSSGTEKSNTYLSLSYYGDNGWTIADNVKRYTMNFRNNYILSDKFSIGFQTVGSYRKQMAPGVDSRQSDPVNGTFTRDFDINPFSYALNTSRTLTAYDQNGGLEYFQRNYAPFNIINELAHNRLAIDVVDVKVQANITWKFAKKFRYEFVGAGRYVKSLQERMIDENSNMANAYRAAGTSIVRNNNKFLYSDPDNPDAEPIVVLPYGGFYNRAEDAMKNYDLRNTVFYNTTIAGKHNISAFVGQQTKLTDRQSSSNTGYGYQYDLGGLPSIDPKILKKTIEANFPYYANGYTWDRFAAFFGHAEYSYGSRYNVSFDGRYDGSNKLGRSSTGRWLPTGTVSAAWNISEENFIREKWPAINFLKLRTSYGLTASMGNATNALLVLRNMTTNRPYAEEKETALVIENLQNADLTWEKNNQFDIGLDGGIWNNRLTFTTDFYYRKGFDLINDYTRSEIGGQQTKTGNVSGLTSKAFEFGITGIPVATKDFKWTTTFNFSYNTAKVTHVNNTPTIWEMIRPEGNFAPGRPPRSLFSIKYSDLDPVTGAPNFVKEDGSISPFVYLQSTDISHLHYEGPIDATTFGGWNNSFQYKNFVFNAFFTYSFGNKIRLYNQFNSGYDDWSAMSKAFYDRFVMVTDEKHTNVPSIPDAVTKSVLGGYNPFMYYNYSDARVAKGDFIRLKSVSLQYMIPTSVSQKVGIKSASLMGSAYNLWLLYSDKKLKGQDPEFFNSGGVAQPIQTQFTFSLRVGL